MLPPRAVAARSCLIKLLPSICAPRGKLLAHPRALASGARGASMSTSARIDATDTPCIVAMQQMLRGKTDVLSLAQGIVHWPPPAEALSAAQAAVLETTTSLYGADDGLPELRAALKEKVQKENGLVASEIMVTAGANQAYTNLVLSLTDAGDATLLFRPYYFNHLMALQMTGSAREVVLPASTAELQPDMVALRNEFESRAATGLPPLKMVTLVNPGNPTGVMIPHATLEEAKDLCAQYGAWLVVDNTYENFAYKGCTPHKCVEGPHVVNIFSFSKAYGMMGWRVGYLAFPSALGEQLFKTQDTIIICPSTLSQKLALAALREGASFVANQIAALAEQKEVILEALSPLGEGAVQGGSGAIYLFCKLPAGCEDDKEVVRWMVEKHGVCLIPGSACGMPGHVRVCYANLPLERSREAAKRLKAALLELTSGSAQIK
ncbi:hypothetical protein AB1Y20_017504 [Prymnesium parvum]|uniref:Aminotransferase class I/classII large domain-containing protein n=1 Tax=Prymnesium parvum TaxID=97485 RepID=A0AB34JP76_PRYPA